MTPVELIALAGCSRPENGRGCPVCVSAAEAHVRAVEAAGMVVVPADDLRLTVRHSYMPEDDPARAQKVVAARDRLRAALDASLPPEASTEEDL